MNQIQYGLWSEILLFESAYKKPSNVRFVNSFFFFGELQCTRCYYMIHKDQQNCVPLL